jgi:hypothetical protein
MIGGVVDLSDISDKSIFISGEFVREGGKKIFQ